MALNLIGGLLEQVLEIARCALNPTPGRAALYSGAAVAYDQCDCDGQVWVRLILLEPVFGDNRQPTTQSNPCGVLMWRATIGVGVLRCAATLSDNGDPPPPSVLTAETLQMTADMSALSEAVSCTVPRTVQGLMRVPQVQSWTPLGPEGGCVGGEWTITALVNTCQCPE